MATIFRCCKKILNLITIILLVANCGFQIAKQDYENTENNNDTKRKFSYQEELSKIVVQKHHSRLHQVLSNHLYQSLNSGKKTNKARYLLVVNLQNNKIGTFITSSGAVGRNKITLEAEYSLKEISTNIIIASGNVKASDNYNISENRFGTYTAEQEIAENLTKIVSNNLVDSLINDLNLYHQKNNEPK